MNKINELFGYQFIKKSIEIIDKSSTFLSLNEISNQMFMSKSDFQRSFSKWSGVSSKFYKKYLLLDHSKELLKEYHSTLLTVQKFGPSRSIYLYDLFIKWEVISFVEYVNKKEKLKIFFGWFYTPFGEALVLGTKRGICGISFCSEMGRDKVFKNMKARWSENELIENPKALSDWVSSIITQRGTVKLYLIGTPFQIKVWESLFRIPSGYAVTYANIAVAVGSPKAFRAVGSAVGKNPISWLIPCHRVLRSSGELGGYHWGLNIKRAMLAFEAVRRDAI